MYILHVHKVHVVHYMYLEYHVEPTAMHVRKGIVILLRMGGAAPLFLLFRLNCTRS